MKLSSVRFRLTLWNIGILTLVLFGFLAVVHFSVRSYLLSEMDGRLTGIAERHVEMVSEMRSGGSLPSPPINRRPPLTSKRRIHIMLRELNMNGKSIDPSGKQEHPQQPPLDPNGFKTAVSGEKNFSTVTSDDTILRVLSYPVRRNGRQTSVVQVAASFAEVQVLLETLTVTLIALIPVTLLVAGIGGLFLTSRALKPVRQMVKTADAISDTDLSQRLPVIGADEFAHLASTINGMLARLDKAFMQLREAFDRERRFTSDASHELRTPLTTIKANTSLALRSDRTPEQYREVLVNIDQSADSMSRLIQDLLLLARSDAGQLAIKFDPVDPRELLNQAVAMSSASDTSAKVSIDVSDTAGMIYGDREHLLRLVINLLDNALRYTPAHGEVILQVYKQEDSIVLAVKDTGEGIASEHLPHLGERFYRVDSARAKQSGGTGLGLAICRSIVNAHGGQMTIDSTLGQGTCVIITFKNT